MADVSPLSTLQKPAPHPVAWGRFTLQHVLGQGPHSVTWLALDPKPDPDQPREVALKLPVVAKTADAAAVTRWVQQARRVSRLAHAHIVPVLEADVLERQPYLVYAQVPGQTLASRLAQHGALPPDAAVALALQVLDALAEAHAAGIMHRNLKASNVLLDAAGQARLLDFGTATWVDGAPVYLSPEAAQNATVTPLSDVFSAGLLLAEMLAGQPLLDPADPDSAQYRLAHEQLVLPAQLGAGVGVDASLHAIVARALDYEPTQRHPGAQALRDALQAWLDTPREVEVTVPEASAEIAADRVGSKTLDALLERMRNKSDFPAMSDSVARIQGMASSESASVGSVTNEILKDVALTNKLLRMVNSAHFAARDGSISTVSRAVSLVGFNGIRNMALSLVLLEHMGDKAHANVLKDEFLRSLMAGSIAVELCSVERESEEAFIGAMFQNLGRMLAEFYFPNEARTVRGLMAATHQPMAEAAAATSVLGADYATLGVAVAKAWGLPEGIQRCMHKPRDEPPLSPPVAPEERVRWIALVANEIADILLRANAAQAPARLAHVAQHYARTLGISADAVRRATVVARRKLIEMAAAMELKAVAGSGAAQLLQAPKEDAHLEHPADTPDALAPLALHATPPAAAPGNSDAQPPAIQRIADILTSGIQDITDAMVDDVKLGDVLHMILETMFRAMHCQRIIFCMRDPKTELLTGRFGLGEGVDGVLKSFQVALKAGSSPDLFSAVCLKGADTMINDATEARIAERLPAWYRKHIHAATFLLLPLVIQGKPVGLIYADTAQKNGLALGEKELALLRTLRNQAVMAFKQAS